ncbi:hypothetical protein HMPREF0262_01624 [Clostridium sp. ATCC 29733]|nr:hypothetical protein HMPREF0262_01624 [Clostridium sp. ATCC 29733]
MNFLLFSMYFLAVRTKRTLFLFYIRNKLLSRRKDGRRGRKSPPIGVLFFAEKRPARRSDGD